MNNIIIPFTCARSARSILHVSPPFKILAPIFQIQMIDEHHDHSSIILFEGHFLFFRNRYKSHTGAINSRESVKQLLLSVER